MDYKAEADSAELSLRKLASLTQFIGVERDKWQKQYGSIALNSALENMVRDNDVLIAHLLESVGLLTASVRDLYLDLDAKSKSPASGPEA